MNKSKASKKESRIYDYNAFSKMKKQMIVIITLMILVIAVFLAVNVMEYRSYQKEYNTCINNIMWQIKVSEANISDREIMDILDGRAGTSDDLLYRYGIDIEKDAAILANERNHYIFLAAEVMVICFGTAVFILYWCLYNRKRNADIREISEYIAEINAGNYQLRIDNNTEDELSILKNEVYKTTIMLKEAACNSRNDKLLLKSSLSDISHQIKTPLTSIIITLDNLKENPDMDEDLKRYFLDTAKKDADNISFMVQSLLKLSRLDSNTVVYNRKTALIKDIIEAAVRNVSVLADLKGIEISVSGDGNAEFICDSIWQTEALTNILKNGVEHAEKSVAISYESSRLCTEINIENDGTEISDSDLPHIFERFYRGDNARENSVGIGLALAKTIIEKDNGYISCETKPGCTVFNIKYI